MLQDKNNPLARKILIVDSCAGLLVGLSILFLPIPFADWYSLPAKLVEFMGVINIIYGLYSGCLVTTLLLQKSLHKNLVRLLIFANSTWSFICIGIVVLHWSSSNILGISQIIFESIFVQGLAILEYKYIRDGINDIKNSE